MKADLSDAVRTIYLTPMAMNRSLGTTSCQLLEESPLQVVDWVSQVIIFACWGLLGPVGDVDRELLPIGSGAVT